MFVAVSWLGQCLPRLSIVLLLVICIPSEWVTLALTVRSAPPHQHGGSAYPMPQKGDPSSARVGEVSPWTEGSNLSTRHESFDSSEDSFVVADGSKRRLIMQAVLLSVSGLVGVESCSAALTSTVVDVDLHDRSTAAESTTRTAPTDALEQQHLLSSTSLSVALAAATVATTTTTASSVVVPPIEWSAIVTQASKKALGGGKAGASASVVQVCTLMWLRTSMNYQYRYGGNLTSSLQTLWNEGGIGRLYQGLPFALVQGPLTRFGDTAANIGIMALLQALPDTQAWPLPLKTACGSVAAGVWRIFLMPIDASKTALQVEGTLALQRLWASTVPLGPGVLYRGALAQAAATAVGHFPWFLTYNYMDEILPLIIKGDDNALLLGLVRSAVLGLSASCVSDCVSNSLRVIKTTKQTAQLSNDTLAGSEQDLSYPDVVKLIVEKDGLVGLFGRGLQTRLLTNAIQGAMFSILWKYFQQLNGE